MSQLTTGRDSTMLLEPSPLAALAGKAGLYVQLAKVRITSLVVVTAFVGFAMAAATTGWNWTALAGCLLGVALACMGAGVLNQIYERDTDALMRRTQTRPLPSGRIGTNEALLLAVVWSVAGVGLIWLSANLLAAGLTLLTIIAYAAVYTPMKRATWVSTMVGAVPGAMPPLIGYAAASGSLAWDAWSVFAIMAVWQLPHFYAIAWLYREDYARASLPMLPVVDHADGRRTFRHILVTSLLMLPLGLLPAILGASGGVFALGALVLGGVLAYLAIWLLRAPSREAARRLFLFSLLYLPLLLALLLLDLA